MTVVLGYAGGHQQSQDWYELVVMTVTGQLLPDKFGPITEIAPDAGIFEADM